MTGEADLTWIGVYNAVGQMKAGKVKLIGRTPRCSSRSTTSPSSD
jgi:hypothetical protein